MIWMMQLKFKDRKRKLACCTLSERFRKGLLRIQTIRLQVPVTNLTSVLMTIQILTLMMRLMEMNRKATVIWIEILWRRHEYHCSILDINYIYTNGFNNTLARFNSSFTLLIYMIPLFFC